MKGAQPVRYQCRILDVTEEDGIVRQIEAMVPIPRDFQIYQKQFETGQYYPLIPLEVRSKASHGHYFAAINEGFSSLPESLTAVAERLGIKTIPPQGFANADVFRAWALCETNWCNEKTFDFDSVKDARMVARLYRSANAFCQILVRGAHVTIKEPKSQSHGEMAKDEFEKSKHDVLNLLETMIGVAKGTLMKEAGKSA